MTQLQSLAGPGAVLAELGEQVTGGPWGARGLGQGSELALGFGQPYFFSEGEEVKVSLPALLPPL